MKIAAILAAGLLTASAPAFAQEAGAPGATGSMGPLSGHNIGNGTGYGPGYYNGYNGAYGNGGYYAPAPAWGYSYGYGPQVYDNGPGAINESGAIEAPGPYYGPPPGMIEGRAAAPDYDSGDDDYVRPAPRHHNKHWRDRDAQGDNDNQW